MALTMIETLKEEIAACVDAAFENGWDGNSKYELTERDCEWVAGQVKIAHGRYPTAEEWTDAGYPVFKNSRYCHE